MICVRWLAVCCGLAVSPAASAAPGEEFAGVVAGFSQLEWLAGAGLNEEPLDNNDWLPEFEGAAAVEVELSNPHFAAADALGRVFIADKASHSILRIDPDGRLFTQAGIHVAGTGQLPADPATTQALDSPNGLFVKPDGTVFIYDTGNHRIRRVAPDGTMTTVINDASRTYSAIGRGLWVSPDEKTVIYTDGTIVKQSRNGVITTLASGFEELGNIDVHPLTGRLYVTDRASTDSTKSAVWRLEVDGTRTRVAGNGEVSGGGDGWPATETFLDQVRGIAFTPSGGYYLCTHKGGDVWYVDLDGIIHLFLQGRGSGNRNDGNGQNPPLIATNDTGYIRRVRHAETQRSPAPEWLTVAVPRQGSHHLQWTATPRSVYLVERSLDPAQNDWTVVAVTMPENGVGEWSGPAVPTAVHLFYRIAPPR
jgi:DNA-binding beta-propeller fold protein YncE